MLETRLRRDGSYRKITMPEIFMAPKSHFGNRKFLTSSFRACPQERCWAWASMERVAGTCRRSGPELREAETTVRELPGPQHRTFVAPAGSTGRFPHLSVAAHVGRASSQPAACALRSSSFAKLRP